LPAGLPDDRGCRPRHHRTAEKNNRSQPARPPAMSRHAVVAGSIWSHADADAVLIENGQIAALTQHRLLGDVPATEHAGGAILPAFTDSHLHPLGFAALFGGTSLMEAETMGELRNLLAAAAAHTPAGHAVIAQR